MPQVSTYPSDEIYEAIESYADHHDIPRARAAELLIEEGLASRADRYQTARLEAKIDRLLEEFAVDVDSEEINEQAAGLMALGSPLGGIRASALSETPAPPVLEWVRRGRGAVGSDEESPEGFETPPMEEVLEQNQTADEL